MIACSFAVDSSAWVMIERGKLWNKRDSFLFAAQSVFTPFAYPRPGDLRIHRMRVVYGLSDLRQCIVGDTMPLLFLEVFKDAVSMEASAAAGTSVRVLE